MQLRQSSSEAFCFVCHSRVRRFGDFMPELPSNIDEIIKSVSDITDKVHFATVCFYHSDQKNNKRVLPLYRGHCLEIKFSGLSLVT